MTDVIDQTARDLSRQALAQIAAHERVCEERAKRTEEGVIRLTDAIMGVQTSITSMQGSVTDGLRRVHARIDEEKDRAHKERDEIKARQSKADVSSAETKARVYLIWVTGAAVIGAAAKVGLGL